MMFEQTEGANEQIQIVTEELMKRNQEAMFQQDNIKLLIDEMRYLQDKHAGVRSIKYLVKI